MKHNRTIRTDAQHETHEPRFKRLKSFYHHHVAVSVRRRIAAENAATRSAPDGWAAVEHERRKAQIHAAMMRVTAK